MKELRWRPALLAIPVVMGVFALGMQSRPARADCIDECASAWGGYATENAQLCMRLQCNKPSYGAIAYGRTSGAYGYSYSWGSEAKAESVAMQNCAANGNDCEVMVWFEKKCGAVSAGDGGTAFWGLGGTDSAASADAQQKCASGGGQNCAVQVTQCSR